MKNPSISAFFPAHNEAGNIEEVVIRADAVLKNLTDTYEIIVVDDGSSDQTGAIIDRLARENSHLRAVHHGVNKGYGAALKSGIAASKYDWIFFTDGDGQFDFKEISKLLEFVPEYKAVIGYRADRQDSAIRLLNAWCWNMLIRIMFGLKVRDIDCAFKLIERNTLQSIELHSDGAMISSEMLIRLKKLGIQFKEIPVKHLPRMKGNATGAKVSVVFKAFAELMQLRKALKS